MSTFAPWLVCPECGFDEFTEDTTPDGEAPIQCPSCGEQTDRRVKYGTIPTTDELAEVAGVDPEAFEKATSLSEPAASDEPEVTEDRITFEQDEEFYQAGQQPFYCPECGNPCEMECDGNGLQDTAYCNTCYVLYTRSRKRLVDDVSNGVVVEQRAQERDVYEEYTCEHCGDTHPYTRPAGQYESPSLRLHSYEEISLQCRCGEWINGAFVVGETASCPSCPRRYTLTCDFESSSGEIEKE